MGIYRAALSLTYPAHLWAFLDTSARRNFWPSTAPARCLDEPETSASAAVWLAKRNMQGAPYSKYAASK